MVLSEKTQEILENLPYHKFIGLKIVNTDEGFMEIRVPVRKEIGNINGVVHGGIYYTLCDLAASFALWTVLSEDAVFVTSNIDVSVISSLSTADKGELIVKANILKLGKRLAFLEASIFNEDNQLIAAAHITKTNLPKKK